MPMDNFYFSWDYPAYAWGDKQRLQQYGTGRFSTVQTRRAQASRHFLHRGTMPSMGTTLPFPVRNGDELVGIMDSLIPQRTKSFSIKFGPGPISNKLGKVSLEVHEIPTKMRTT